MTDAIAAEVAFISYNQQTETLRSKHFVIWTSIMVAGHLSWQVKRQLDGIMATFWTGIYSCFLCLALLDWRRSKRNDNKIDISSSYIRFWEEKYFLVNWIKKQIFLSRYGCSLGERASIDVNPVLSQQSQTIWECLSISVWTAKIGPRDVRFEFKWRHENLTDR